ncbi:MAG: DUF342 domain-containing protein [Oscillospiraceae bacterium]|nr:DUF342 domain-containing protein [Oscillospiraceae bacterium]
MAEKENKKFGFFRSLFEKKTAATDEQPQQLTAEDQNKENSKSEKEAREAALADAATFLVGDGCLQELWQRWNKRNDPLTISLLGDGCGCEVVLSEREIIADRLRLTARVERDAKEFLKEMNRYEEKKLKIEARKAMLESQGEEAARAADNMPEETLKEIPTFCHIYLSANGMQAWALLIPPSAPDDLFDRATVDAALKEAKVVNGVSDEAVEHIVSHRPYFTLVPVACGTPVQEGENGRVIEHFSRQLTRSVKVDNDGVADYRALNYIQTVNEGDVICDIVPPRPGTPGVRVDGAAASPAPVKAAVVPARKYTKISDDGTQLIAEKTGHLEYDGSKFSVKVLLDIPGDVDYSTGNLDYNGDIHIHGDVRGTFEVKATGNIIIDGLVEAAKVEAGGDVLVSCGVLGDGNAEIICGGDLRAKYLESCTVYVGKSVFADCVMSSQVYCDETIQILSGRGAIIGGSIVAGKLIKSKIVGTDSGRKTDLELGAQTYIKMKHGEEIEELKKAMAELARLDRDIAFLEKKHKMQEKQSDDGPDEVTDQRLAAALLSKNAVCARIDELTKVQKEIEDKKPDLAKCRFECATVYPPTMLLIGGAIWKFEETKNNCAAWLDKVIGEINVT